jgi:hypothetical protein
LNDTPTGAGRQEETTRYCGRVADTSARCGGLAVWGVHARRPVVHGRGGWFPRSERGRPHASGGSCTGRAPVVHRIATSEQLFGRCQIVLVVARLFRSLPHRSRRCQICARRLLGSRSVGAAARSTLTTRPREGSRGPAGPMAVPTSRVMHICPIGAAISATFPPRECMTVAPPRFRPDPAPMRAHDAFARARAALHVQLLCLPAVSRVSVQAAPRSVPDSRPVNARPGQRPDRG